MADVSTRLRRARERAHLQIADVSATTKIKPAFIAAIDGGELHQLPGQFFTRAFLKAYAAAVGLDPAEVARQYDEHVGRTEPLTLEELAAVLDKKFPPVPPLRERLHKRVATLPFVTMPSAPALPMLVKRPIPMPSLRLRIPQVHAMRAIRPAVVALLMVIATVAAVVTWTPNRQAGEAGAVGTSGIAEAAPATASAPVPAPDKVTIDIMPAAQIWVAATTDGKLTVFRMLQAGERVSVSATQAADFRIGNAAAFRYTINGVPGKAIGGPDEVREFQITPQNFHSYVR